MQCDRNDTHQEFPPAPTTVTGVQVTPIKPVTSPTLMPKRLRRPTRAELALLAVCVLSPMDSSWSELNIQYARKRILILTALDRASVALVGRGVVPASRGNCGSSKGNKCESRSEFELHIDWGLCYLNYVLFEWRFRVKPGPFYTFYHKARLVQYPKIVAIRQRSHPLDHTTLKQRVLGNLLYQSGVTNDRDRNLFSDIRIA